MRFPQLNKGEDQFRRFSNPVILEITHLTQKPCALKKYKSRIYN
jgi:hypothetical protein